MAMPKALKLPLTIAVLAAVCMAVAAAVPVRAPAPAAGRSVSASRSVAIARGLRSAAHLHPVIADQYARFEQRLTLAHEDEEEDGEAEEDAGADTELESEAEEEEHGDEEEEEEEAEAVDAEVEEDAAAAVAEAESVPTAAKAAGRVRFRETLSLASREGDEWVYKSGGLNHNMKKTDDEMQWLRIAHRNKWGGGAMPEPAVIIHEAIVPTAAVDGYVREMPTNNPANAMTNAEAAVWCAAPGAVNPFVDADRAWIHAHRVNIALLPGADVALAGGGAVVAPAAPIRTCSVNLQQAMAEKHALANAGTGTGTLADAQTELNANFGNVCPPSAFLTRLLVKRYGVVAAELEAIAANLALLVVPLYASLDAPHRANTMAFSYMNGWLYGTRTDRGNRLMVAVGVGAQLAGNAPAHSDRVNYIRADSSDGVDRWGWKSVADGGVHTVSDTAGHVRGNFFGGTRDPLNFVPQAPFANNRMSNDGEQIAQKMVGAVGPLGSCGANSVRLVVSFEYNGVGLVGLPANNRRPTFINFRVDLILACDINLTGANVAPVNKIFVSRSRNV